jgi:hypothetical protein
LTLRRDSRQFVAKYFHGAEGDRNISVSIDPKGVLCLSCDESHCIRESMDAGLPLAVVLSVQSFPPVLPNSDCKCIVVVREENGRLFKIEKVVKGTVARDFWPLVFFMNRPHMGPLFTP